VAQIGGCFAPPLSDEKLASYKAILDGLPASPVKDAMSECYECCAQWWELPESTNGGTPHPVGRGVIVPLDAPIREKLFDAIPWDHQLKGFASLFDGISNTTDKPLRDAAFHMLWHAVELFHDREPLTNNLL
jgi:hypothetical protein